MSPKRSIGLMGGASYQVVPSLTPPPPPVTHDYYLAVWGNKSLGTSLYTIFSQSYQDIWLRFRWRRDVDYSITTLSTFMMGLINNASTHDIVPEYINAHSVQTIPAIAVINSNAIANYWVANPINANNSHYSHTNSDRVLGDIVDLHCSFYDIIDIIDDGTGTQPPYARWNLDVYVDDVLRYTGLWGANFIPYGGSRYPLDIISGLVIFNQYGSYGGLGRFAYDDIKIGTTQGGSNIFSVDFNDGTYAPLIQDGMDSEQGPAFAVEDYIAA